MFLQKVLTFFILFFEVGGKKVKVRIWKKKNVFPIYKPGKKKQKQKSIHDFLKQRKKVIWQQIEIK